jgi:4-hydroxybenzoate polyprenyltransferase
MVAARTAAMAFNRLVDERFDRMNPRTRQRHLPQGLISRREVWGLVIGASLCFSVGAVMFWPNWLPIVAAAPVLAVLLGYSYAKRFTAAAHLWLGFALGLAPLCAWIAIRGLEVIANPADLWPAIVLGAAVTLWVAGFDIIYACQDAEFDRQTGLHSLPSRWGIDAGLRLAERLHFAAAGLLAILPLTHPQLGLGWLYGLAWLAVTGLLAYEHWLVSPVDLSRVGQAFFQVNAAISLGLCSAGIVDCLT